MLYHQRAQRAAAGRRHEHGYVLQCMQVEKIKKMFKNTSIRATVNGRRHHQRISLLDSREVSAHVLWQLVGVEGRALLRADVGKFYQFQRNRPCSPRRLTMASVRARVRDGRCRPPETATTFSFWLILAP